MLKRRDIRVRDPYIVLCDGKYYMYATTGERTMSYYVSDDLENWTEGGIAFEIPENFWAYKDVWASEVHKYNGKFYLFVSLLGKNGLRGTQIAVSNTPSGPFIPIAPRAATPLTRSCIDGSLYVRDGKPYIFYSLDWPDNFVKEKDAYVGSVWALELTPDLTEQAGEPFCLFKSDQCPISRETPDRTTVWEGKSVVRYGSDAPFVQDLPDGRLLLTWSPYLNGNYVVLGAVSESGDVKGPWKHLDKPIFDRNGGHAMFFDDKNGRRIMCIHAPERNMEERAHLFYVDFSKNVNEITEELPI